MTQVDEEVNSLIYVQLDVSKVKELSHSIIIAHVELHRSIQLEVSEVNI
jgi:hypothetical protein